MKHLRPRELRALEARGLIWYSKGMCWKHCRRESENERRRQTGRQTNIDRQTERQIYRKTDGQTDRQTDRPIDIQTDRWTGRQKREGENLRHQVQGTPEQIICQDARTYLAGIPEQ